MTTNWVNGTLSYGLETCDHLSRVFRNAVTSELAIWRSQATGIPRATLWLRDAPRIEPVLIANKLGTVKIADCIANSGYLGL